MKKAIGTDNHWVAKYSDIIQVKNEQPIFGITYENYVNDEFLYSIQGNIKGFVWKGDLESSLYYYFMNENKSSGTIGTVGTALKNIIDEGVSDELNLAELLKPFLNLLQNGNYRLFYTFPFPKKIQEYEKFMSKAPGFPFEILSDENVNMPVVWGDNSILMTQSVKNLDQKRVQYYEAKILAGNRPTIITLGLGELDDKAALDQYERCPKFIIDGHHKAQAYLNLRKKIYSLIPSLISIVLLVDENEVKNYNKKWRVKIENSLNKNLNYKKI